MKRSLQVLSFIALLATLLLPALFFTDTLSLEKMQFGILGSAVLWFLTAPFWMEHKTTD